MFHKIDDYFTSVKLIILVAFTTCLSANDQVPTFNLKNKSSGDDSAIAVVIHAKDDTMPKFTQIKNSKGIVILEGMHIPSQPIVIRAGTSISYYGLRNLTGLDTFYIDLPAKNLPIAQVIRLNDVNDRNTFYLKFHRVMKYHGAFSMKPGTWTGIISAQEGSNNKTTDGYSLANNIKNRNIESLGQGPAGSEQEMKVGTSVITYPTINLEDAISNTRKLQKAQAK